MLFYMCVPVGVCFFVHEKTPVSPHVCVKRTVTEGVLPLPPSKNPWRSWHNRFSVVVSTIFSRVPVKLGFCEAAPTQSASQAPALPVLSFYCDCASPVMAAEGTEERGVEESTLTESLRSQNHESPAGWPELRPQTFSDRKQLTVASAACLWCSQSRSTISDFDLIVTGRKSHHNQHNGYKNQAGFTGVDFRLSSVLWRSLCWESSCAEG